MYNLCNSMVIKKKVWRYNMNIYIYINVNKYEIGIFVMYVHWNYISDYFDFFFFVRVHREGGLDIISII